MLILRIRISSLFIFALFELIGVDMLICIWPTNDTYMKTPFNSVLNWSERFNFN